MDTNPYQAPSAIEPIDAVAGNLRRRSWVRYFLGSCCFGISLFLVAISFTVPNDVPQIAIWVVMGTLAVSCAAMGSGMFTGRDSLALIGFILFILPLAAAIFVRIVRIVGW